MKKLIIVLTLLLLTMSAKATVTFTGKDLKIKPGETTQLELSMTNDAEFAGFQFDIVLPEGITVQGRTKKQQTQLCGILEELEFDYSVGTTSDGYYGIRVYSTDGLTIDPSNGKIITVNVKADENMALGEKEIKLTNIILSQDGQAVDLSDVTFKAVVYQEFSLSVSSTDDSMGGVTGDVNGMYESGTSVTVTATPNEGYHFVKWSNDVTDNPYTFTVNSDVTLTATFDPNLYTIIFDSDGGTEVPNITASYKSALTKPADPTKEGYTFAGWDPEFPETMPLNGATLKATWTPIIYTISYDLAGGALAEGVTNAVTYTIESENITLTNPTREGYTFSGWTGTGLTEATATVTIAKGSIGNREYAATWTPITYTVTYDLAGGALAEGATNAENYTIESENITLTNPTREGYTFAGWTGTGLTEATATVTIAKGSIGNREYAATWTPITYTVTYDLAGGALAEGVTNAVTYTIESENITLTNPTREGYTFAGWTGTGLTEATATVTIAKGSIGNREYAATWTPITYTVTYDLAGGTLAEGATNAENYTIESENITLTNPTREGYTFAGWTGTGLTEATATVTIAKGSIGNREYAATWTPITYTVTYDLAGGALAEGVTNAVTYTIQSENITLTNPTREGYTFAGWTGTGLTEATAAVTIAKGSTGNRSYTATWMINQYVMTFVLDNGEENIVKTQDYDSALTAPEAPVKTGFTFKGWSPDVPAKVPASDQTFTAQWERNSYVLKFVADGVTVKEDRVLYEGEIVKPEDPQKEGYTFTGWTPEVAETMPAEDVTYTAQFSLNQYTITFNSDGGTAVESITADYQSALTKPADPTKTGYDFAGWEPEFPETMPLNGASLKATWTPVTYTITYDLAGGALAEGITNVESYTIESEAITLNNPTREGYTFAGWTGTDLAEATAAVTIAKGSTGNRSYTATWTINQYMMTFVLDNGEENIVKTQKYDSALTAPEAPVKTGFTFKGWSPDVPAKVPASDQTFTAQWERNSYVLKFVVDGVTVKEERVFYEGEIVKPEDPQKEGYTFAGWTPEVAETMPAENVTYTAQFTVNQYAVIYIVDDIEWTREYVNYGDEIVLKEYPVEDGQSFSGWTSDVEYQTMPAHDVVFTASLITTRIAGLPSDVKVVNIYDVRGTLLYRDMPVEQVRKQLPKGIYIINGRKYVVK